MVNTTLINEINDIKMQPWYNVVNENDASFIHYEV